MKWYTKWFLAIVCTGLFLCSGWGSVAWLINRYAQQDETRPADAAIVLSSETLFAAMFGFLLLNERLTWAGMVGCLLIFVSMLAVQLLPLITNVPEKSPST